MQSEISDEMHQMDKIDQQISGVYDEIYRMNKSAFINPRSSPKAEGTPRLSDKYNFNQGKFTYQEDDSYRIVGTPKSHRKNEED